MSMIDNFLNIMRLSPEDEDDFEDSYEEEAEDERPRRSLFTRAGRDAEQEVGRAVVGSDRRVMDTAPVRTTPKITPIQHNRKGTAAGMEVCVFKPTSVEDAREITETLLLNRTVLLNVEGLNIEIAQRIIDFVSGATFAIAGNLQKVSNFIFVLTPKGVDISGDFQDLIGSFDIAGGLANRKSGT